MPKLKDRLVITGCDSNTEWQLPWFIENYAKYNTISLCVADFGMTEPMLKFVNDNPYVYCTMHMQDEGKDFKGWFYKPLAMANIPSKKGVWLDTDCQVLGNIEGIFNHIETNKLSMAIDRPWLLRRQEEWHNSGVVGFEGKPEILMNWVKACKDSPVVGDQEVLHSILNPITKMTYIKELPNIYNWLRLQIENDGEDSKDKKIMHWTGKKGNDRIRGLMKIKEVISNA